jgi:hypothetical protein
MKQFLVVITFFLLAFTHVQAQDELAATLEVLDGTVTVQRVGTSTPIAVSVEAIVGVGDVIRTDETGRARITFFADGTDTELLPNTEYSIEQFEGDDEQFNLSVSVFAGQTIQRLSRIVDANSSYDVNTPSMALAARGTIFSIRVEDDGRSGMIVSEGMVVADDTAEVPAEFGIRADEDSGLSDVVRASSFAELDAALDGCTASVSTVDDTRINVRLGPSLDNARVGTVAAADIGAFLGINTDSTWYRIAFRDNFGWVLASSANIEDTCAGLRVFEDTHQEDPALYSFIGDPIELELTPEPTPPEDTDNSDE